MKLKSLVLATSLLFGLQSYAKTCDLSKGLNKKQIRALKSAKRIDRVGPNRALLGKDVYTVDVLSTPGDEEFIVLLGEAHIKGPRSAIIGKKVVKRFKYRMLEGAPADEVKYLFDNFPEMKASLGWGRILARVLTFNFFGSTISASDRRGISYKKETNAQTILDKLAEQDDSKKAQKGVNLPLEIGRFITPSTDDSYILDARNERMVENINEYVASELIDSTPLVIIGAAHNKGMMELLEDNSFKRCSNF